MKKSDLEKYKNRLTKLRERLTREVNMVEEALLEDAAPTGELSHVPTHPADHASEGVDEQIAVAKNEGRMLVEVEHALKRVEEGTFGRCTDCEKPIPHERLEAMPYTPWCIACARKHDGEPEAGE